MLAGPMDDREVLLPALPNYQLIVMDAIGWTPWPNHALVLKRNLPQ